MKRGHRQLNSKNVRGRGALASSELVSLSITIPLCIASTVTAGGPSYTPSSVAHRMD